MSRCFPFPPPGYMRNGSCGEALIESIKLQREAEKAKKELKEQKRREKKEKKKAKKENNDAASHSGDVKEHKHREKKEKKDKKKEKKDAAFHSSDVKEHKHIEPEESGCLQKVDDYYENELLERSDITKEHDQPYSGPEPCCSDSTQSSNKRKRSTSPSSRDHGSVIKLRFSLKKHKGPEESKTEDQVGSSKNLKNGYSPAEDNNSRHQLTQCLQNAKREPCIGHSDSRQGESFQNLRLEIAPKTNKVNDASQRTVSPYDSLFQNWVALPLINDGFESDDQNWLFSSKEQEVSKAKPITASFLGCSSTSLWPHAPRAQYLSEVEMYALPYTIPF